MGFSLGSIPSIYIASKYNIKSLILIAPLASEIRLIKKESKNSTFDFNKEDILFGKISEISCPIFLIHGQEDKKIPISQSFEIFQKVKNANTWFPKKGDHYNIFTTYRRKFYEKFQIFFDKVGIFHCQERRSTTFLTDDLNILDISSDFIVNNNVVKFDSFIKPINNDNNENSISWLIKLNSNQFMKKNRQENNHVIDKACHNITFDTLDEDDDANDKNLISYDDISKII